MYVCVFFYPRYVCMRVPFSLFAICIFWAKRKRLTGASSVDPNFFWLYRFFCEHLIGSLHWVSFEKRLFRGKRIESRKRIHPPTIRIHTSAFNMNMCSIQGAIQKSLPSEYVSSVHGNSRLCLIEPPWEWLKVALITGSLYYPKLSISFKSGPLKGALLSSVSY